jgi:KTSC domain-containing protein
MQIRKKLVSSSIAEVGYDVERKILEILFTSGGLYSYEAVPEDVFKTLIKTDSPGVFFASNIRNVYAVTCLRPRPTQEKSHGTEEAKKTKPHGKVKNQIRAKNAQI